ncbi:MAG: urease accessory protein UreH domain-containing protein [Coriobacteriia bacterium]
MSLFYPMLLSGLLTSFHCVMMCGNMVLSYAVKGGEDGPLLKRMVPHFAYHSAKILSYTIVGLLLGSIGEFISPGARSWVSVVAGVYMVLLGLQMTGKFPQLNKIQPRPPKLVMNALMKLRRKADADAAEGDATLATPVSFGLMTGLMPCGPLIAAQVAAAGSGSAITGGFAMLGFGLGTAPLMLGYGAVASFLGARFKRYMAVAAAIVIIVLGGVMVNRGATALGWPVNYNVVKNYVVGGTGAALDESAFTTGADGVVEVPFVVDGYEYRPSTLVIPADKPVRLIVDRKDANLCSDELWIPKLGIQAKLAPSGITTIDLPASASGNYQITCQMGMLSGTLQVGAGAVRSTPRIPVTLLLFVSLTGAGLYAAARRQKAIKDEGARHAKNRKGRTSSPAPQPKPSGVLGLQPQEAILAVTGVAVAALLGLSIGGYFA